MMKYVIAMLLWLGATAVSQAQSFTDAKGFGGPGFEVATKVAADGAGNVWVLGNFSDTTKIADSILTSRGGADCFLAKFNANSELLWTRTFGSIEDDFGFALVHDSLGNVYVAGVSEKDPAFDSLALTGYGEQDIVLAKYDPDGNLLWARVYGGTGGDNVGGLVLEGGHLYLTGTFQDVATFGGLSSVSDAERAAFVLKTDTSGNSIWVKKGICFDRFWDSQILGDGQGNIYFFGQFSGLGYFGSLSFGGNGFRNYVLIKLNADGRTLWAKQIEKAPNLEVAWAPSGGILLTGTADYEMEIDNRVFPAANRMWVARLDTAGNLLWYRTYAEGNSPEPRKVIVASDNSFYLVGAFKDSLRMGEDLLRSAASYEDKVFMSHLDENGNVLNSIQSMNFGSQRPYDIAFLTDSSMVMVGIFRETVTMGDRKLKSKGSNDIFLAHLSTKFVTEFSESPSPEFIRIYPNPSDGLLNIDAGGYAGAMQFELYSLEGKLLQSSPIYPGEDWTFIEVYQPGLYIYRVLTTGGKAFSGKIMRQFSN